MSGIPFVDAHVHFWDLAHLRYPWLMPPFDDAGPNGSVEAIARTYLPDDYLADVRDWNMVGAVHVEAGADPAHALAETEWLEGIVTKRGLPAAIVAFAALESRDVEDRLAEQAAHGSVRGIRHIVNWHPDPCRTYTPCDLTGDPAWQHGYRLLARHGLSFDLQCYPGQMPALAAFIASVEDVPVAVNHLGMPVLDDRGGLEQWRAGMRMLAAIPHVHVKLSGPGFADRAWTTDTIRPLLAEAVEMFGTRRCMMASDLPTDRLFAPVERYRQAYAAFADGFHEDERRDLFGRNANAFYRLGLEL